MTKQELRKLYRSKRQQLNAEQILAFSDSIFYNFENTFHLQAGDKVHIFLSINRLSEVYTQTFIGKCWKNNVEVYVPKINGDEVYAVQFTNETPTVENHWGIIEPASTKVAKIDDYNYVIVPLLYADDHGNRVGYGKGFYDRFLIKLKPSVIKLGVSFFPPKETIEDVSSTDIPLDYLITPEEVLSFTGL